MCVDDDSPFSRERRDIWDRIAVAAVVAEPDDEATDKQLNRLRSQRPAFKAVLVFMVFVVTLTILVDT